MSRRNPQRVRARQELIDAWTKSGQSINGFCRARKLTRSHFDRRRRLLAAEPTESKSPSAPAFVPLRVVDEPVAEVVLLWGVVARLPPSAAPEVVGRLGAAGGAASC